MGGEANLRGHPRGLLLAQLLLRAHQPLLAIAQPLLQPRALVPRLPEQKKNKRRRGVEGGRGGVEGGQKHLFAEVGAAWGRAADEGNISLALGEENKPTKKN